MLMFLFFALLLTLVFLVVAEVRHLLLVVLVRQGLPGHRWAIDTVGDFDGLWRFWRAFSAFSLVALLRHSCPRSFHLGRTFRIHSIRRSLLRVHARSFFEQGLAWRSLEWIGQSNALRSVHVLFLGLFTTVFVILIEAYACTKIRPCERTRPLGKDTVVEAATHALLCLLAAGSSVELPTRTGSVLVSVV